MNSPECDEDVLEMTEMASSCGGDDDPDVVGPHGMGARSYRGHMLANWCIENGFVICFCSSC